MVYLYIGKNSIKLLSLSKTLLGQFNISFFQKNHENDLLEDGKVKNVDLVASAVKEALTLAKPNAVTDTQVYLVLPQDSFQFVGYDIPVDISETAIAPFVRDKARAELKFDIETALYDYLLVQQDGKAKVLLYAQNKNNFSDFSQIFKLLGLTITAVLPETLAYYKLFEKTIRADKQETFFYVFYDEKKSFGYLFNSYGLLQPKKYTFTDDIETSLKTRVEKLEKESVKVNRIILSGGQSEKFRQDLFTKKVGVWTNPLKKIILNFYQEYVKLLIVTPNESLPLLDLDACLGAFIFSKENTSFSFNGKAKSFASSSKKMASPGGRSISISKHDFFIFIVSFIISFAVIFLYPRIGAYLNQNNREAVTNSPLVNPTPLVPTAVPTPVIDKKTINIKVLNGTGTKGFAGDVKEILQKKGYSEILTGNADTFDNEKTTVQVKDDKKVSLQLVLADLKDRVTIDKENITTLSKDESADIILVVGKDFQ